MKTVLEIAGRTHRGRVRLHNEDAIGADPKLGFAVLADGMGGHNAGEVASRMAVDAVSAGLSAALASRAGLETTRAEELIASHISLANSDIFNAASSESEYQGMGTTVVVALWHQERVSYGHVGDSRLYLLRDAELEQLTRDHSLVQEQIDLGLMTAREAHVSPYRHVLTRALGTERIIEADVHTLSAFPEDLYLLCSDGLTDMLDDDEIRDVLVASPSGLAQVAQRLIDEANRRGGVDNISVVLARVCGSGESRP